MPVFLIWPTRFEAEELAAERIGNVRMRFKAEVVKSSPGRGEADVHINLLNCIFRDADPAAPDLYIYADTCPGDLEELSDELSLILGNILITEGLSVGRGSEVWLRFLAGSWRHVRDEIVVDHVNHTPGARYAP